LQIREFNASGKSRPTQNHLFVISPPVMNMQQAVPAPPTGLLARLRLGAGAKGVSLSDEVVHALEVARSSF